jgi:sugar phosphate isomerase/epimerase
VGGVHPRVCLSGISTWNSSLDDELALVAELGVPAIGVSLRKLDAAGWDEGIARVRASGVRVANVIGVGPFALADPAAWPPQRDRVRRVRRAIDAAAELDAGCVVLTTGPAGQLAWEDAADALEAALAPVLEAAAGAGVTFALEHTNSLRVDVGFVHTLRDDVDLAQRLGTRVCMEVNACWAERGLVSTITGACSADALALVQVSDFAIGTRCTPERLVPGDGDIPLHRIGRGLCERGPAQRAMAHRRAHRTRRVRSLSPRRGRSGPPARARRARGCGRRTRRG